MSEVTNSHYVARLLTRPWEDSGHLHYFDLESETIEREPAKKLFAVENLFSTDLERKLNRFMENSVGLYKKHCAKNGDRIVEFAEDDPRMIRALYGLVGLQGARADEALRPERPKYSLEEMLQDDASFEGLISLFMQDYDLIGGTIPASEWLLFPSLGYFTIPVVGFHPAMAVPISPTTFIALVEKGADLKHLGAMVRQPCQISVFSAVGGGLEHKLVIPAEVVARVERVKLIEWIKFVRTEGRRLYNLYGKMAETALMRSYGFQEPPAA